MAEKTNDYLTKGQSIWCLIFSIVGIIVFILWVFLPDDYVSLPILGLLFYGIAQDIRIDALTRALNRTERVANDAATQAYKP